MAKWHSRLTLLKPLIITNTQDGEGWVSFSRFYSLLSTNKHKDDTQEIRKGHLLEAAKVGKKGYIHKDDGDYINVKFLLRYVLQHSEKVQMCKRITNQIIALVTNQDKLLISDNEEIYDMVAEFQYHPSAIEENFYSLFTANSLDAPQLEKDHEKKYTPLEWKRIALFEKYFASSVDTSEMNYNKTLLPKWEFLQKLESAKELYAEIQSMSSKYMSQIQQRKDLAARDSDPYIVGSDGTIHHADNMDIALMNYLSGLNVKCIKKLMCVECPTTCKKGGIHVLLALDDTKNIQRSDIVDVCVFTKFHLSTKHGTECCEIFFITLESMNEYSSSVEKSERFHAGIAIGNGSIETLYEWINDELPLQDCTPTDELKKCSTCYPDTKEKALSYSNLDVIKEWILNVPIMIQLFMQMFAGVVINTKPNPTRGQASSVPTDQASEVPTSQAHETSDVPSAQSSDIPTAQGSDVPEVEQVTSDKKKKTPKPDLHQLASKKLKRLYFVHDIMLNIANRKHFGILQERNTYELIMGNRSVNTVFQIASSSGATMSLTSADTRLNEKSSKDLCLFNTYQKHHDILYVTAAGPKKGKIRIKDCDVKCIGMDNLVRLKYHADPSPGEHRSKQICTLPITIKGIPPQDSQLMLWHDGNCNKIPNCSCKASIALGHGDHHLATDLLKEEEAVWNRFEKLLTWGLPQLWEILGTDPEMTNIISTLDERKSAMSHSQQMSCSKSQLASILEEGDLDLSMSVANDDEEWESCSSGDEEMDSTHDHDSTIPVSQDMDSTRHQDMAISASADMESSKDHNPRRHTNIQDPHLLSPILGSSKAQVHFTDESFNEQIEADEESIELSSMTATEILPTENAHLIDMFDQLSFNQNDVSTNNETFNLYEVVCKTGSNEIDTDLEAIIEQLDPSSQQENSQLDTSLQSIAKMLQKLSCNVDKNELKSDCLASLQKLHFKKFDPPAQIIRHPPPAIGKDDSIEKLQEVLDDIMLKSGHEDHKGHRMLFAPDNKIGLNLLKLKEKDTKYASVIPEFPVLHLRKSKITNLCSAYKDIGIIHLLMYMRDTNDNEWSKLIEASHIDQATRFIKRLSLALHLSFHLKFITTLPSSIAGTVLDNLSKGSFQIDDDDEATYISQLYMQFITDGIQHNATFAAHHEMMMHCDEIVGLHFSERLGGDDGYNLLLAIVKKALPFSFLTGSSSYAHFSTSLLDQHYRSGFFCRKMKASLYTGPYKNGDINFALDTQREMDHQDVSRSFHSGGNVDTVVNKMASVDFLVHDLQSCVKHQDRLEVSSQPASKSKQRTEAEILGMKITTNDLKYAYRGADVMLRKGALSCAKDDSLTNIYESESKLLSSALLDRDTLDVGKYLALKCIAKNSLFGCKQEDIPNIQDFKGPEALKHKAATTKYVTIKRTATKLEKDRKTVEEIEDEKRKRLANREKKNVECLTSKMNACQAVVTPDCGKNNITKSTRIKNALMSVLVTAYRSVNSLSDNIEDSTIENELQDKNVFKLNVPLDKLAIPNVGILTFEFAGVKFKKDHKSGDSYLTYSENILEKYIKKFEDVHHAAVCEEKYSFTPDIFKSLTRKKRAANQEERGIDHLRPQEDILTSSTFNKNAVTKTMDGKQIISTYLAQNVNQISLKHDITIDFDSELHMSKCKCSSHPCSCKSHANPIRCIFECNGSLSQMEVLDIKQCKGEAEMSQVDWVIDYIQYLIGKESSLSVVLSGDIDAVILHLFTISHRWPRDNNGDFVNQVYVYLDKPQNNDLYNITAMIRLLEKAFPNDQIAMKIALFLCIGGNDFLPSFYSKTNKHIINHIMSHEIFRNDLIRFIYDGHAITQCYVDETIFQELLKCIYCDKRYNFKAFTYEEVRQMSIRVPKKSKKAANNRNPRLWLPPPSAAVLISKLAECHCKYMLSAGNHSAPIPDVTRYFRKSGSAYEFNFDDQAYVKDPEELLTTPADVLLKKMTENTVAHKKKVLGKRSKAAHQNKTKSQARSSLERNGPRSPSKSGVLKQRPHVTFNLKRSAPQSPNQTPRKGEKKKRKKKLGEAEEDPTHKGPKKLQFHDA